MKTGRTAKAIALVAAAMAISSIADAQNVRSGAEPLDKGEKIICKRTRPTGTRMDRKMCHTRADWSAIEEDARRAAAESFTKPIIETRRGN